MFQKHIDMTEQVDQNHKFNSKSKGQKEHTDVFLQALSTHSANSRVALSSADNENRWTASSPISNFDFCMQLQKKKRFQILKYIEGQQISLTDK